MLGFAYVRMACLAVLFGMTARTAIPIRELSAAPNRTETVSGQVLDIIDSAPVCTVVLFDGTGGIPLYVDSKELRGAVRGDLVTARVAHAPWTYVAETFAVTGHAALPTPVEVPAAELERRSCRPVAIRGVLRSVHPDPVNSSWNWMSFATPSGTIPVAAREADFPIAGLRPLLDAELRLAGYAQPMVAWRAGLGLHFSPVRDYPLEVLREPPSTIRATPPFGDLGHPHRQHLSGTVLATSRDRFFVRTPWGVCEVYAMEHQAAVQAGDRVTVAGFFEPSFQGHRIEEARVQVDAKAPRSADSAVRIGIDDLFNASHGGEAMSLDHYHQLVTLAGDVKGTFLSPNGQRSILLGDGRHTLLVDVSLFDSRQLPDIRPGGTVEVTGLCHADFDRDAARPAELKFRSFVVFPRTA